MIPTSRRPRPLRGLVAVMAAALVPVIAGCEAGLNAPVEHWHQPTPGASAVAADVIRISNMFVLGAAPGSALRPGTSAGVFLALANDGAPDTLTGISAPGAARAVTLPGGQIRLGRQQIVLLSGPAPRVVMQGLTRPLQGGQAVPMVLTFANAGSVTLRVPVMPRVAYYAGYSPAPAPSPSATGTPKHHKLKRHVTPSPSPSA